MARIQPKCIVECYVNMQKMDAKLCWKGDPICQQLMVNGYKKHDEKEILFKSIEVPEIPK